MMYKKGKVCFLFLDPQDEVGPSISSSVFLRSSILLVCIVVRILVLKKCSDCPLTMKMSPKFTEMYRIKHVVGTNTAN
jgi:hypothetical protein